MGSGARPPPRLSRAQQSPGSQGPRWPRRWGRGEVKPAASWAAGGPGKWGSPPPQWGLGRMGRGLQPKAPLPPPPSPPGSRGQMHPPRKYRLHRGGRRAPKRAAQGRSPPPSPQGHGSTPLPTKTCSAALHPPGGDEADPERWKCLNSRKDNSRRGERKKNPLGNFLQVSI